MQQSPAAAARGYCGWRSRSNPFNFPYSRIPKTRRPACGRPWVLPRGCRAGRNGTTSGAGPVPRWQGCRQIHRVESLSGRQGTPCQRRDRGHQVYGDPNSVDRRGSDSTRQETMRGTWKPPSYVGMLPRVVGPGDLPGLECLRQGLISLLSHNGESAVFPQPPSLHQRRLFKDRSNVYAHREPTARSTATNKWFGEMSTSG